VTRVESISEHIKKVKDRIAEAALRVGRQPDSVTLVAVTKTLSVEVVLDGYSAGLQHFGENRPEEGASKIPKINAAVAPDRIVWHMIGHVQGRKAGLTVAHFDKVHSVDRVKIARRLGRIAAENGRTISVLLECNVSGEASKYGFQVDHWREDQAQADAFFAACTEILKEPGLRVQGLMTMAPFTDDPETSRPVFADLRALGDNLAERFPEVEWSELSMGMTDDFEVAVEEGATLVRIGRALFGERK
jgi:pyridoxal phosphate enzyme (YggS family)